MFKYPIDLGGRSFISTPDILWAFFFYFFINEISWRYPFTFAHKTSLSSSTPHPQVPILPQQEGLWWFWSPSPQETGGRPGAANGRERCRRTSQLGPRQPPGGRLNKDERREKPRPWFTTVGNAVKVLDLNACFLSLFRVWGQKHHFKGPTLYHFQIFIFHLQHRCSRLSQSMIQKQN